MAGLLNDSVAEKGDISAKYRIICWNEGIENLSKCALSQF